MALLLVAFWGWGQLLVGLLRWDARSVAVPACLGIAVAIGLGGVLNLARLVSPGPLIAFVLIGCALAIAVWISRPLLAPSLEAGAISAAIREKWSWKRLALVGFVLLFLFRAASTAQVYKYLPQDDENFYLVMPVKMMQTHHYAADPFSERRIESSLGGSYFLQCLVLSALPLRNIQMSDHFVGFILIVLLALALARRFDLSPGQTVILGLFSICLVPLEFNLTYTVLPSALWLAMVLVAANAQNSGRSHLAPSFAVGLLAGAICALKSTYLPYAVLFCAALFPLLGWTKGWRGALGIWLAALAGALLVLIPWMVAMKMTSGTFLYPILGSGYDYSAYPQFPRPFTANPLRVITKGLPLYAPLVLILLAQLIILWRRGSAVFVTATVICLFSSIATGFAAGVDDLPRYVAPMVLPTLLLAFVHFASEVRRRPGWKMGYVLVGGVVAVQLMAMAIMTEKQYYKMAYAILYGLEDRDFTPVETRAEYAKIAAALPKDGPILATLQDPYLLDFSGERIFLADYPGCAGLPPGWPIHGDGDAVADYLLSHSIRYLAYTYAGNAQLDSCHYFEGHLPQMSVRSQVQYGTYLVADAQYRQLRATRRVLYDDGQVFMIDLASRSP